MAKDHLSLQFYGSCCPPLAFLGIAHTWCQHFHKHTFHTRSCIFSISSPASHSQNHDYKAPSCLDSTWQSSPVASLLSKVCCLISFTEANGIKIFACNLLIIAHLFFFFKSSLQSLNLSTKLTSLFIQSRGWLSLDHAYYLPCYYYLLFAFVRFQIWGP